MMGFIRVAHVLASFEVGGLQKGVVTVVNGSDPEKFEHLVVSLGPETAMAQRLTRGRVESLGLAWGERRSMARPLARLLRSFRPHVVHTRNWPTLPDGWLARRLARVPFHVHGYHGRDAAGARAFGLKRRIVGRFLTRFTDRVIVLTPAMGREYQRDFGRPRRGFVTIPNGVDIPSPEHSKRDPASPFRVLAVGRLDPVKDYPSLIRAFATFQGRGPDDRLIVVGGGPLTEDLKREAARQGVALAVEFPGVLASCAASYAAADVFVQSSVYEGMSNTLAEAMATGLPVIATRVGGNPDVVGDAGILYEAGNDAALAAALSRLRADPAQAKDMGARARERCVREFTVPHMIQSYCQVYEDLVKGRD